MMRSFVSSLKAGFAIALLVTAILPSQAEAQSCNADVSIAPADPNAALFMGEPISLVAKVGAGTVVDLDMPGDVGYLDISQFEFKLDCNVGEDFTNCTDAGNTVNFVESSLWTNCTDGTDDPGPQPVVFQLDEVDDTDKLIVFTPTPPPNTVVRNMSNTTCDVGFDVIVEAVVPGNNQQVYEMIGWINTDANLGVCSNGLPADESASILLPFNLTSTFRVTKDFSDTPNPTPVDVHIRCDAGLPLEQSFTISESSEVNFTVKHFLPGELDCRVWEDPVDGYDAVYVASSVGGVGIPSVEEDGCHFNQVENGGFLCAITNNAGPATFTVNKEWIIGESETIEVDENVDVTISCDGEITTAGAVPPGNGETYWTLSATIGDGGSLTADLNTSEGPVNCMAEETFEVSSAIEAMDNCGWRAIPSGVDDECTFVNSVFFEGIPTLSQYGLAILVLLTLGVGMIGFRRFA